MAVVNVILAIGEDSVVLLLRHQYKKLVKVEVTEIGFKTIKHKTESPSSLSV